MFSRFDKKTLFFSSAFIMSLVLSLPTFFAKIPFLLNLPFISSSQPTRLLFIACFSLSVLAALGFDYFIRLSKRNIFITISFFGLLLLGLWFFVLGFRFEPELLNVSKRNLYFPSLIFAILLVLLLIINLGKNKLKKILILLLIIIAFIDGFRFFTKFNTFSDKKYFFPETSVVNFLKKDKSVFRIASLDSRTLAPNFLTFYKIQSVEGYDPLFLKSYAEFVAASERGRPDISPPYGFNRIITPHNVFSNMLDLLNVKYILSLDEISSKKFEKVFESGKTKVYENKNVFPRVFFVEKAIYLKTKEEQIKGMFENDLAKTAVVGEKIDGVLNVGKAVINSYAENEIIIKTNNEGEGFLVLTDAFYPSWKATIDGKMVKINKTDYTFRGLLVPKGEHEIKFYITL